MTPVQLGEKTRASLVEVKGGTFQMGDFGAVHADDKMQYSSELNDSPLHAVTVSDFAILKNKVSLVTNPRHTKLALYS